MALGSLPLMAEDTKRPNIVFIISDDHRWNVMSHMGHPFIKTPNMDRLAREGVRLSNAFVTTSLCSSSRACFLTSKYVHLHGVRGNQQPSPTDKETTFPQLLQQSGYETAYVGKWHMDRQVVVQPGSALDKMVLNIDLAPTLLDIAGVKVPSDMQGRSFRPLLEGKKVEWRDDFFYEYFAEKAYPQTPTVLAVRTEDGKYVEYPEINDISELYDLRNDPTRDAQPRPGPETRRQARRNEAAHGSA